MNLLRTVLLFAVAVNASACTAQTGEKASLPPKGTAPDAPTPEEVTEPTEAMKTDASTESDVPATVTATPEETTGGATQYRLTGEVASTRQSQIAFRVGGFISSVAARPGSQCKKGDVLATLDDRDYVLKVELAKAKRGLAKVTLDSAAVELEREKQLQAQKASTPTVFDKVKAGFDQARLSLKLADIELTAARQALADTKLQAPYDCVVAEQLKYEGENVQSGAAVFQIYDVVEPEIALTAPERLMGQLTVGTELNVTVPSAGFQGMAKIIRLVPVISEKTRTFQVFAKLDQPNDKIVPGSYAEALAAEAIRN